MPFNNFWSGSDFPTLIENALEYLSEWQSSFDTITREDIVAASGRFSSTEIPFISGGVGLIQPGTIFLYMMSDGLYGKLQVVEYEYNLTIKWVTSDPRGGDVSSGPELVIRGAWSCDLDKGVEVKPNGYEDFSWIIKSTGVDQFAVPTNKALFGIY